MQQYYYQPQPRPARPRSRKSVFLAIFLQSSPLLTVAGCTKVGLQVKTGQSIEVLLDLAILFAWMVWGLGYAYLGEWKRFLAAFLLGPIFVLASCTASFQGVHYDFEHGRGDPIPFYHAALQQAIIIGIVTVLVIIDVWRLAATNNARLAAPRPAPAYFYEPDPEMDELDPATGLPKKPDQHR
jgi:hypothetical protein